MVPSLTTPCVSCLDKQLSIGPNNVLRQEHELRQSFRKMMTDVLLKLDVKLLCTVGDTNTGHSNYRNISIILLLLTNLSPDICTFSNV